MLNPANNEFATTIKGVQQRLQKLETTTQPAFIDWLEYNPGDFTYSSATRIDTGFDATSAFQIGDKLRIKHAGDYQYFYIVYVQAAYILIAGGDNYTFTASAITSIASSRLDVPTDWPAPTQFVYAGMSLELGPDTGSMTPGEADVYFDLKGQRVTLDYETTTSVDTASNYSSHLLTAEIPSILVAPSGLSADQTARPRFSSGRAQNAVWSEVWRGIFFSDSIHLETDANRPWPQYAQVGLAEPSVKFGNTGGSSSNVIYGICTYIIE